MNLKINQIITFSINLFSSFRITYRLILREKELHFHIGVYNPSKDLTFSFNLLLHTYLKVPDVRRCQITGLHGCTFIDKVITVDLVCFIPVTLYILTHFRQERILCTRKAGRLWQSENGLIESTNIHLKSTSSLMLFLVEKWGYTNTISQIQVSGFRF